MKLNTWQYELLHYVPESDEDGVVCWKLTGETRTIDLPADVDDPKDYIHRTTYDQYQDLCEMGIFVCLDMAEKD